LAVTLNMPKISWQRHRLAELTASLNHTGKEAVEEGILGRPASDWSHDLEEEEEGPLELVTRRIEQDEPSSSSPSPSIPSSPPRTLAARKAYDEPLDVSIQRKVQEERSSDDEVQPQKPASLARYHPYLRPSESEQDAPINLEVPKKPWYKQQQAPVEENEEYIEEQPIDFSKKKPKEPPSAALLSANKEYRFHRFQRNLLVVLLQSIARNPVKGRDMVRFLKTSCEKVQQRGCSNNGAPKQTGQHQQGAAAGGSGFSGVPSGGGSTGGSPHSSRSNSTDQEDTFNTSETGFDSMEFDFADSATRKWMCENPDLNPLKVLDHINFKNEVTEEPQSEVPKPPDLSALDRETATFLQLAVPVPDPSSTFLDIGTDFGPVSMYEDDFNLEQLIPSTFNLPTQQHQQTQQQQQLQQRPEHQLYPLQQQQQHMNVLNMSHTQQQLQHRPSYTQQTQQLNQNHLAFQSFLPETSISLRDPMPLRREEERFPYIKEEALPQQLAEPKVDTGFLFPGQPDFRPISPIVNNNNKPTKCSPAGPSGRKKSTSGLTDEEEDLLNVPSLQMRIQILQQRYSIPADSPLELINGGHGIKNPMVADLPEKKEGEKLPPMRCENDPSRFACRICGKTFGLARLLNRHMKCHSDSKRYLCTFCGKGFNDTFDLKRHTRTHTGVRPYKCNLCEKSFTQRCSLESHCLKVHGVTHCYEYKQRRSKVYVCEDCGHTTKEPEVHYLHLKEQHPYSPALLKFYDKRHFKFNSSNFGSNML